MKYRIAFTSVASAISLVLAVVFVPTTMARSSAAPSGFCYYNCGGGGGGGSAPAKPQKGDERINPQHGDDLAILYDGTDSYGYPALDVYCIQNGNIFYGFQISLYAFQKFPAYPQQNTLVTTNGTCGQLVEFWVLTSGEYQVMIHRPNGAISVVIFTGLPAAYTHFYDIE